MADELSPRVLQFFGQQIRDRQAEEAAQRERARAAPPPAPAAPPTAPPAQPAARLRVVTSVMTPDELSAYCAEFGFELGEKPPANTLVRPWNNPDPLARRERLRKAETNRIAIEQMRREKAAAESARIARLEAQRKNVRHKSSQ